MPRIFSPMALLTVSLAMSGGGSVCLAQAERGSNDTAAPQAAVPGGLPALLIDAQLTLHRITVASLDDANIYFRDEQGREKRAPLSALAAIIAPEEHPISPTLIGKPGAVRPYTPGALLLTDGRRFPGQLTPTSGDADRVHWSHPVFGDISFPLDSVAALMQPSKGETGPPAAPSSSPVAGGAKPIDISTPPTEDWLVLVNGDRLSGFLESLGNPVRLEVKKEPIDIPPDRVAGAAMSNPRTKPEGVTVWLADGTVAHVQRASTAPQEQPRRPSNMPSGAPTVRLPDGGAPNASTPPAGAAQSGLSLTLPSGQSGKYALTDLRGIVFDAARLRSLSSLAVRAQRPLGDRRWAAPIELVSPEDSGESLSEGNRAGTIDIPPAVPADAYDLLFPGPMAVTFDLPEKAERIAGEAELDPFAGAWADCEAVILIDNTEMHRARLARHAGAADNSGAAGDAGGGAARASTTAPFNVAIPAGARTVTIAIEPGRYGPIMDRVYVRRGLVLVGR